MSNAQEVNERIEDVVADRLQVETDAFDDATRFDGEALDAESLDMVEIAEAIEAEIGVHIPDDDLAELETVGALKAYVSEHT